MPIHAYVVLSLIVVGFIVFRLYHAVVIGAMGEHVLNWYMKFRLGKANYVILHDVMLPTDEGTTQIDHIVVSPWGVFVIETKTHSGTIYGKEGDTTWTEKYCRGGKSYTFQNPLNQNAYHITILANCLGLDTQLLKNVVAFAGTATFGKEMPENVLLFSEVPGYIKAQSHGPIVIEMPIRELADKIIACSNALTPEQRAAHVANLRKRHDTVGQDTPVKDKLETMRTPTSNSSNAVLSSPPANAPLCPRCNVPMVPRQRKEDGAPFWGCPNYPTTHCRETISMDAEDKAGGPNG